MYKYSYIIANSPLAFIWILFFLKRKDFRFEMLSFSVLFGVIGFFVQPVYLKDWWHPLTITNTFVGIEDFLFGFLIAGIASVIYEFVFKKKIQARTGIDKRQSLLKFIYLNVPLAFIFFGSFAFLGTNSFWASVFGFLPLIIFVYFKRRDLILDSLVSGALMVMIGFIWFYVPEFLTPGWVENYWYLDKLSGIIILKAPLEDLIWVFLAGAYIAPLYEFWRVNKLVKL